MPGSTELGNFSHTPDLDGADLAALHRAGLGAGRWALHGHSEFVAISIPVNGMNGIEIQVSDAELSDEQLLD